MKILAIVSGGLDSVTMAYSLKALGYQLALLSFNYGQRHNKELGFAEMCGRDLDVPFQCLDISSIGKFLTSSLTDTGISVPDGHYESISMRSTVVPNRNAIMLSIAFGVAMARGFDGVSIANHSGDHFIYPDCRPEFIDAFQIMQQASGGELWNLKLLSPFIKMSKGEIVKLGAQINVPFSKTWSCYKGGEKHCGTCGTCVERKEAFQLASVFDPTEYVHNF